MPSFPEPRDYYADAFSRYDATLSTVRSRARSFSVARVAAFVLTLALTVYFANERQSVGMGLSFVLGMAVFAVLVRFYVRLDRERAYLEALAGLCGAESRAQDGDFSAFASGAEHSEPGHPYAYDLDLFGEGSVFQALDRTATHAGRRKLAGWLLSPALSKGTILSRQAAAEELSAEPGKRLDFLAVGKLSGEGPDDRAEFAEWLAEPAALSGGYLKPLLWAGPVAFAAAFVAAAAGLLPWGAVGLVYVGQFAVTGFHLKRVNLVHAKVSRKAALLGKYADLLAKVEGAEASAEALTALQARLRDEDGRTASARLGEASALLERLDQRGNVFAVLLLTPTLLWDLRYAHALESWRERHKAEAESWLEALAEWDALLSLSAWRFNRPGFCAPVPEESGFVYEAEALGHPLIAEGQRVDNDYSLEGQGRFSVVTGANMAGKSTFLRAVGVNLALACAGANVCAARFRFTPVKMWTSMRTTDSLQKQESYFYAEISRLKAIVDALAERGRLFVILDEMLKGTNSEDQRRGSVALLRKLSSLGGSGLAATHDLELGKLAEEAPERFENRRFEAEIVGDELRFDYRLQPGVCCLFNATFLMERMGLTDAETEAL